MEALGKFMFPSGKEAKPLQSLSPERVNATRPASTISATTTKGTYETESEDLQPSPYSSPTRRAKADLFADYHPTNGSPKAVSGFALPQSPSMPEINALRSHVRNNSDVQGLVKRFEHLDVRDRDAESTERRKKHEAELRRAQIAREEAESDVKRLREEMRQLKKDYDDGRDRERQVAKRLEAVLDDFGTAKESHAAQSTIYEKEVRKARKEAFKSSSAVLKLQEELKSTRNTSRITQSAFELEKQKVERKEQERFEMQYQLIPLQEQVEKLTQRLNVAETERDTLMQTINETEVARIAAEGMIALPVSQDHDDDDLLASPRKQSPRKRAASPFSDDKENLNVVTKSTMDNQRLADELEHEKMRREHAEELADFLRMECRFRCCECQSGTILGHDIGPALDDELAAGIEKLRQDIKGILLQPLPVETVDEIDVEPSTVVVGEQQAGIESEPVARESVSTLQPEVMIINAVERSVSMAPESPKSNPSVDAALQMEAEPTAEVTDLTRDNDLPAEAILTVPLQPSSPITPTYREHQTTPFRQQPSIRTVTTITTVPMHFTPVAKPQAQPFFNPTKMDVEDTENIPPAQADCAIDDSVAPATPTFDRAAALAAIEYRRGRAKSIADGHATPRKQMIEGVKERRDISAPALGAQKGSGGSLTGRLGSAGRVGGRR